jgi:acyl-CoA synthetase (AMP-forming)/AMP-acid ligase II
MIMDHIFSWARREPGRIALRHDGYAVSYGDFAQSILVARAKLASMGCSGPGIAVLLTDHIGDGWVLSLALRSLGLTTLVPPAADTIRDLPLSNVRFALLIEQSAPQGIEQACRSRGFPILRFADLPEPSGIPPLIPQQPPGGHILLTSGTTGRHKMLLIEPEGEDEYHAERRRVLGIDENTVFHVFNCGLWTGAGYKTAAAVWAVGGTVVIQQAEPIYAALLIPGTHAVVVPSTLADILAAPEGAFPRQEEMQLSLTGGRTNHEKIEEARRRISPNLYNRLSSTEASIFGFTPLETREDERWHRPVPGRSVQVVDAQDRPLPPGALGHLRVSTKGGPCRYLGDPEATAACFRNGFFYPGDLAVAGADGRFALQGRATDVININGHKVSPAPIEERLQEQLGASGACLFSTPDDEGQEHIHLVIEASSSVAVAHARSVFRDACRKAGVYGDIDAGFTIVDQLPRTRTGKIIRSMVKEQFGLSTGSRAINRLDRLP